MRFAVFKIVAFAVAALAPQLAHADPCEGALPTRFGAEFAGTVRYIVDGDGFCVGESDDPQTWIEVRLVDFDAPELNTPEGRRARAVAVRELMGRHAQCTTARGRSRRTRSWDRAFARCSVGGRAIGAIMRAAGAPEGGN